MQWKRGWEGGDGGREVERLLSSTSESTVNNTGNYRGRQKKKEGRRDSGEQEGQGGRQGGRKKGPRRVNITVLCQANIRCWDTSTKSHRSFGREEDGAREKEWAKMRVCGNKQRHPVKSWEMESESMERQTNSCCC